ncbi:MAG TPA: hypothetical protein VHB48_02120, partial [Chitinophagaceae bacterium]|nr:hypothetical protein [Chitinophagaceae bacterium]
MKKTFTCLITLLSAFTLCNAQKNGEGVVLNNYSTSYAAKSNTEPFVLTAIPYGGMYNMFQENTPLDLSVSTSDFRYRAQTENYRELDTYDSSEVYFYVPNVFARNAAQYEYRVMKNQKEIITGWSSITHFTKGNLQVEDFKKNFASLGGYKTTWNNYITVELRKKGTSKILSAALVYWKQVKPAISAIYPSSQLNNFLIRLKRPWDGKADKENAGWQKNHMINNMLVLQAPESSLIFYLDADIYKRDALEYQLEQDGKIIKPWQPNDFDNGIIWLNNLSPGEFILRMRFSGQRHNVTSYPFKIKPEWHQTTFFKIIAGGLIAAFFSFIIVLLALGRQKRRT